MVMVEVVMVVVEMVLAMVMTLVMLALEVSWHSRQGTRGEKG